MVKEIMVNRKTEYGWEIIVHTYNIYQDYFTSYTKDVMGQVFHNQWELSFNKSKGRVYDARGKDAELLALASLGKGNRFLEGE